MRFLANENFPYPSIKLLRQSGYEIISIYEEDRGLDDESVLKKSIGLGVGFSTSSPPHLGQRNVGETFGKHSCLVLQAGAMRCLRKSRASQKH